MNRETARQKIRSMISCREYLEKSPKGNYICPFCGSGTGPDKSGALQYYENTNTWHCFSGKCGKTGDVIDLYQKKTGTDYNEALSLLADSLGITIDSYSPGRNIVEKQTQPMTKTAAPQQTSTDKTVDIAETDQNKVNQTITDQDQQDDYMVYYKECRERLNDPEALEYLEKRGISQATAIAYWIGYDPQSDPAGAPGAIGNEYRAHPVKRLIIPTSNRHYVARRIDEIKDFAKLNPKGSKPGIFNSPALRKQELSAIFVTEGIFDALAIIEAGAVAIAINSANNAETFIERLKAQPTTATLILCLDNDESGKKAEETIKEGLRRLNISFITANICGKYKDPNEALVNDKQAFIAAINEAQRKIAVRPDNTSYYIDHYMMSEMAKFNTSKKKTGFPLLDGKSGGLYAGIYVLAALSSLGKTSFALQLADQLASSGNDVIFFSLEQSKLELVSKSIARMTAVKDITHAVNSLSIRSGYWPMEAQIAAEEYKEKVKDRMTIVEGNFNCDIYYIGDYIRNYIEKTETKPVIFIDYLQILQPGIEDGKRQSVRESVDSAVTAMKRLSRELDITIFLISSVNRANYLTPIDFESLKESGGIEFTADVIWGMQLQCLNDDLFDSPNKIKEKRNKIKECKREEPRKIELVCLKNRFGICNFSSYFDYFAANDLFRESQNIEEEYEEVPKQKKAGRKY